MPLSDQLLEILVCPACKGDLEYDRVNEKLICHACRLRFRIEDDIAIMLIEEAERLGDSDPNRPPGRPQNPGQAAPGQERSPGQQRPTGQQTH